MQCRQRDCIYYAQDHPVCQKCWRSKELQDYYQPRLPYSEQGRIANLLGQCWVEYCKARLTKRHSVRLLALIQQVQMLVMEEKISATEINIRS